MFNNESFSFLMLTIYVIFNPNLFIHSFYNKYRYFSNIRLNTNKKSSYMKPSYFHSNPLFYSIHDKSLLDKFLHSSIQINPYKLSNLILLNNYSCKDIYSIRLKQPILPRLLNDNMKPQFNFNTKEDIMKRYFYKFHSTKK